MADDDDLSVPDSGLPSGLRNLADQVKWVPVKSDDLKKLEDELANDAAIAIRNVGNDPSDYNRRSAVRTMFAFIEGMTFSLKAQCLVQYEQGRSKFNEAELAALRGITFGLDEGGHAKIRKIKPGLKVNAMFALRTYAKGLGPAVQIEFDGEEWQAFVNSIGVRNRITHPKSVEELSISYDEIRNLARGIRWFQGRLAETYAAYKESVARLAAAVGDALKSLSEIHGTSGQNEE